VMDRHVRSAEWGRPPAWGRAWRRTFLAICAASAAGLAHADGDAQGDEWLWTAGLRLWSADWSSWSIKRSSADYLVQGRGDAQWALIPLMSVRHGKALLTFSSLLSTRYEVAAPSSDEPTYHSSANRSEFDVNVGYQLLPGLTGTVGYKIIKQDFGVSYKWAGPMAGISASTELNGPLGLYGNFSLGRFGLSTAGQAGQPSASYVLGDFGLAYGLGPVLGVGQASITVGYRSQVLKTKGYKATASLNADVQDTTQGLVVGVYGSF
jgi:hypothetical protein